MLGVLRRLQTPKTLDGLVLHDGDLAELDDAVDHGLVQAHPQGTYQLTPQGHALLDAAHDWAVR